jgi:hypothetical protein
LGYSLRISALRIGSVVLRLEMSRMVELLVLAGIGLPAALLIAVVMDIVPGGAEGS